MYVMFAVILGRSHYILFHLVSAMQPRMLVTFDEELRPLPVSVRVGQVCIGRLLIAVSCAYYYVNSRVCIWKES